MPILVLRCLAGLLALCASAAAHAQLTEADLQDLTDKVRSNIEGSGVAGFAAAITDGEKIVWSYTHGHVDKDRQHRVTLDTPFRIGSVTKTVTAIAILQLAEKGMLSLDDPISDYVDRDLYQNAWSDSHPVTIANLLEHTAGWDDLHFVEYLNYPADMSLEDGLKINPAARTSRWPAGTIPSYSNAGPALAGRIIEIVSGMPYTRYVEENILVPLGARDSGFDLPLADRLASFDGNGTAYAFTNIWAEPSGGLAMSAKDLLALTQMMMSGGGDVLSPSSVRRMQTPSTSLLARMGAVIGDGPGLETRIRGGHLYHIHSGAIDGFNAEYGYLSSAGLGYVILTNTEVSSPYRKSFRAMLRTMEKAAAPREPLVAQSGLPFDTMAGAYEAVSTRNDLLFMLDKLLGAHRVAVRGETLVMKSSVFGDEKVLRHVGNGLFADENGDKVAFAAVQKDGRTVLVSPEGKAYAQTSVLQALAPIGLLVATIVAAIIALFVMAGAGIVRLFKKIALRRVLALWVWPFLACASFLIFAAILVSALNTPIAMMERLGQLGLASGGAWLASFGLPLFAAIGLFAVSRSTSSGRWSRGIVGLFCAVQIGFAVLLLSHGWVGFTSWSKSVEPYPVGALVA